MTATIRINFFRIIAWLIFTASVIILIKPALAEDANSLIPPPPGRLGKFQLNDRPKTASQDGRIITGSDQIKAKIASREAALRTKLAAFRDKRKAEIADKVNTNLNRINQNQTTQMSKYLSKMTEILDRLSARVDSNSPDIKDPVSARAAILDARAKIASATAAVSIQAGKDYTLQITSETTVRKDAESLRNQLKTDLLALRKLVIDAKQSVANAIRIAKSGGAGATPAVKETTPSGQQ